MNAGATVGQRFSQLISHLGISKNAFANSLDKTATVIQHIVDERNKPGFDLLCKVFEVYPNVSKDWLLQGAGPMMHGDGKSPNDQIKAVDTPRTEASVALKNSLVNDPTTDSSSALLPTEAVMPAVSAAEPSHKSSASEPAAPLATAPVEAPVAAPTTAPPAPVAALAPTDGWQAALYTQQMAHQLALAELRNQHLQEQQRMMQQMLDLMQRQLR